MFSTGSKALPLISGRMLPRRQSSRRLRFETMEARRLLAVFIVDTFDDSATGLSLRGAIIAANQNPGADEIQLPAGTYNLSIANANAFDASEGSLDITDSLVIRGMTGDPGDVIIDGNQLDSVFTVGGGGPEQTIAARFEAITIQNGSGFSGGAISADSSVSLEIRNSVLQNNFAGGQFQSGEGGAVATFGSLLIEDTLIRNNAATIGGGVAFSSFEGATLTIRNSTFSGNAASSLGQGGGLYAEGVEPGASVLISNVTFDQNTAGFAGGGAYLFSVGQVDVQDSRFSSNTTGESGGGLYILDTGPVLIARSTFDGNIANGGGGGGLSLLTDAEVVDSLFENNQVTTVAFAFDEGGGGIAIAQESASQPTVSISRSTIRNNTASLGGGIGSANANLTIADSSFLGNQATNSFGGGGGIGFAQDDTQGAAPRVSLLISGSTIDGNGSSADAGGVGIADADARIIGSSITNNSAADRGGGIGIIGLSNSPSLEIQASTVALNSAGGNGGGIAVVDAGIDLLNVTLSDNFSGGSGGGIAYGNTDNSVTGLITFTTIATNSAVGPGSNVASGPAPLVFASSLIAEPLNSSGPPSNFIASPGGVVSSGFNLDSDGSGGFDQTGDLSGLDPLLGPLADNGGPVLTRALLPGSPAIDAGGPSQLLSDARGFARLRDGTGDGEGRNDIGSFEVQDPPPTLSLGDLVFLDVNNTGVFDPLVDTGIAGVSVSLFRDANFDGVLDSADPLVGSTVTDSGGNYLFTGLTAGDYIVLIDLNNFQSDPLAGPLFGRVPSTANQPAPDPDNDIDNDNNGSFVSDLGVVSGAITLAQGTEPDPEGGPPESNANPTLDLGFTPNAIVAAGDFVTTALGTSVTIDVLANDDDDVESELTLVSVGAPGNGTVQIVGGQIVYTPNPGFSGADSFNYTVSNPFGQQGIGTVTVEVTPAAIDQVDLAIVIDATPRGELVPGQLVDFSIVVQNLSGVTATGVVVTTMLSSNLLFQSGDSDFGSPSHLDNVVTFDDFSLAGNSSAFFSITAMVDPESSLPISEFASTQVSSDLSDPATFNNSDSVDVLSSLPDLHTLTTGSDDGGLVIVVDGFGSFGSAQLPDSGIADFNPLGPLPASGTVFRSFVAVREGETGPREVFQTSGSNLSIEVPIAGDDTVATSRFRTDSFIVNLTQTVEPTFDSQGNRLGSRLIQSYAVTNVTTVQRLLDLARYVDGDLFFDGELIDGGGVLMNADGSLVLFTTDRGGTGASDTTFVGISASGGTSPLQDRFDLDEFSVLRSRVVDGEPLRDRVSGDLNGDGFINPDEEYDVAMALRNLLSLGAGQTLTYETITIFGTRPETIVPPPPPPTGDLIGQVFCDANGNGIQDAGEAMAGVTVFVDRNGNRLLDSGGPDPEPFTLTDAVGNYSFTGLSLPPGSMANVVVQNPPGCFPHAPEIGVTRVALPTGSLSRAIEAVDFNGNGQMDLIVANDLSNDLTVLVNDGGSFSVGQTIPLGNRPQSISVWQLNSQSPAVIAVAAIGTPTTGGLVYVVENGSVQTFPSGNGPISVVVNDFNGDDRPDFVTTSFRSGTIVGRFSGESEQRVLATASSPRSVTSGFINGDSAADLVVVSSGFSGDDSFEMIVLLNDGNGNFSPVRESISGRGGVDVALADITGDGRSEIVVASFDGTVRIFTFGASGSSLQLVTTLTTEVGIEAVAARDLNVDGFVDLVIANARAETVELFMGTADGFVRNRTITGVPSPADLAVADFNRDGLLDVAVANLFGTSAPFRLPSTATILELAVSEREVQLTASQATRADFGFNFLPTPRVPLAAEGFDFDINRDGQVTALDALLILNASGPSSAPAGEGDSAAAVGSHYKTDVNGDGQTTALDALLVLNRLAKSTRPAAAPAGESLDGRSLGDPPLAADAREQDRRRREQAVDALFLEASLLF